MEEVMAEVTRRRFLLRSTLGLSAAAVGGALVATAPRLLPARALVADTTSAGRSGPLVLHVRNAATGEVALMVDTTEFVYRDRELVARLLDAAANRRHG
jgi:hypothetical protein